EITFLGNLIRHVQIVPLAGPGRVVLGKFLSIDPHAALVNVHRFTWKADDAFHDIRIFLRDKRSETHELTAFRIAPQRQMQVSEGNAGVVADAAHDQVVADQESVLHGPRRNHARLAKRAVHKQENENDPHPSNDFALHALRPGEIYVRLFVLWFAGLHASPRLTILTVFG